jgi:UDP-glucose 4-epimerase
MSETAVITGGAGFIGSNLATSLVKRGGSVVVVDNFSTGFHRHLQNLGDTVRVFDLDIVATPVNELAAVMNGADTVYHLAANADVRYGWEHPRLDLEQNLVGTLNVVEAAESAGVEDFVFSSTGSVYGEASIIPTPETAHVGPQTSLYASSKLSSEAFLEAHAEAGRIRATIFRFVSVLGPHYSHGHVFDFVRQLKDDPKTLRILGDGRQRKSYMHVDDCVAALHTLRASEKSDIFNLGIDGTCVVADSARWISDTLGHNPEIVMSGGERGWIGDNPHIHLDVSKAAEAGWVAQWSIEESVRATARWLDDNDWIFNARD